MSITKDKLYSVQLADYTPVAPSEKEERGGWVKWGDDNLFPNYLLDMARSSPVHGALCTSISQMIAGDGVTGISTIDATRWKLNKVVDAVSRDLKVQGAFYLEVIWSVSGEQVATINHLPAECCRIAKANDDDKITGIYYSRDWRNERKNKPVFIPIFNKNDQENKRQVYIAQLTNPGSEYYSLPDYWPSINYVELARQIGVYHVNNILNGLFPAFMVNFLNGVPDPDDKAAIIREWNTHAAGARNAGKAFFTFADPGTTPPQITTFPISDADKQYEFLAEESTKQVMIGHRVTSSLLFGVRDTGGGLGSNTDEMRQALAIFNAYVIKPMQAIITEALSDITGEQAEILPYTIAGVVDNVVAGDTEDVASTALNGAQIASLVEIVINVTSGAIPKESAMAIVRASFPELNAVQVAAIFNSIDESSAPAAPVAMSEAQKMTEEDESFWSGRLAEHGETIDLEEWELVHEDVAGSREEEDELNRQYNSLAEATMSLASYANGGEKSKFGDSGLYKLRYAYAGEVKDYTRDFCRDMIRLAQQGKVYRWEDIQAMGDAGENGQFAPEGQSTYDIFIWKGGAFCHHFWKRQIYFRKRVNGKFMPNDGLKNDKRVGNVPFLPQKGREGVKPIDTPTRGSLKYG